jgi:GNAT superfamily N-acetyltransferase
MNRIVIAEQGDIQGWLVLAREVDPLFGQPVSESDFLPALRKNIARGTAICIRHEDGPPGAPVVAGLLFSPKPSVYKIGWLAVTERSRRQGLGSRLVEAVIEKAVSPAELAVITFGETDPEGEPARRFYKKLGFQPAERAPDGPDGSPRQYYRLRIRR